jgi:IclR family KDG regulon transcriptional repressor
MRSPIVNELGRYRLPALHHALDVLEALRGRQEGVGLAEIAQAAGLGKPGAHRILRNLLDRGYVVKDPASGRYSLGLRVWELGVSVGWLCALQQYLGCRMQGLASELRETIHLAMLDGGEVVYLDKAETPQSVRAYANVGDRTPAYCVATGKVLLSLQPPAYLDRLLSGQRLIGYTPNTITDVARLRAHLDQVRRQGYALNLGEWREGVNGVAVALRWSPAAPVVALGVAGPAYRFGVSEATAAVSLLNETVRAVAQAAARDAPD